MFGDRFTVRPVGGGAPIAFIKDEILGIDSRMLNIKEAFEGCTRLNELWNRKSEENKALWILDYKKKQEKRNG